MSIGNYLEKLLFTIIIYSLRNQFMDPLEIQFWGQVWGSAAGNSVSGFCGFTTHTPDKISIFNIFFKFG